MSNSPSPHTLAKTRIKRSRQVPARFDDFSEIPTEMYYRNVIESFQGKKELQEWRSPSPNPTPSRSKSRRRSALSQRDRPKASHSKHDDEEDSDSDTSLDESAIELSFQTSNSSKQNEPQDETKPEMLNQETVPRAQILPSESDTISPPLKRARGSRNTHGRVKRSSQSNRRIRPNPSKSTGEVRSDTTTHDMPAVTDITVCQINNDTPTNNIATDVLSKQSARVFDVPNLTESQSLPPMNTTATREVSARGKIRRKSSSSGSRTRRRSTNWTRPRKPANLNSNVTNPTSIQQLSSTSGEHQIRIIDPNTVEEPKQDEIVISTQQADQVPRLEPTEDVAQNNESSVSIKIPAAKQQSAKRAKLVTSRSEQEMKSPKRVPIRFSTDPRSLLKPLPTTTINRTSLPLSVLGQEQKHPRSTAKRIRPPRIRKTPQQQLQQQCDGSLIKQQFGQQNTFITDPNRTTRPMFPPGLGNMQYRSRLLLNEPVLLPRSVGKIEPITNTYADMVNRSKKYPFVSRRTEAMLAFQEEKKINTMISFHAALIKIANSIEIRDLLSLRLANKTWKSVVDSDAAWRIATVETSKIIDWKLFLSHILRKHKTQELNLADQLPDINASSFAKQIANYGNNLKHLTIKTTKPSENQYYLEMLSRLIDLMNQGNNNNDKATNESITETSSITSDDLLFKHQLEIVWKVRVLIDEHGLAHVPLIKPQDECNLDSNELPFCYMSHPEWMEPDETFLVEISEISDLFGTYDNNNGRINVNLRVSLEPI